MRPGEPINQRCQILHRLPDSEDQVKHLLGKVLKSEGMSIKQLMPGRLPCPPVFPG